ncbi:MAG: 50S ribosomal protein L13 [Erysipelotrichaceae bacterium]|jgi:large subunit ribosomal protein L13
MRQTTMAKPNEVVHQWYIVDGTGLTLGRLATEVAMVLRGKNLPIFTPNVDCGGYVIIINADKIIVTGNKDETKSYYNHSQHTDGLRVRTTKIMRTQYTVEWVERAVHGMLPHTRLGNKQRLHLFVYVGPDHPHAAQQPIELKVKG